MKTRTTKPGPKKDPTKEKNIIVFYTVFAQKIDEITYSATN
jgi:hypothetical protein